MHGRHGTSKRPIDEGRRRHVRCRPAATAVAARLAHVDIVARSALSVGTVLWTPVPYVECDGWKTRPAVVLDHDAFDVEVWPITTSPWRHRWSGYVELIEWEVAGLTEPSSVQRRVVTVERREVIDVVGELSELDRARLDLDDAVVTIA